MDSLNEDRPISNLITQECDKESNKDFKGANKPTDQGDGDENVFTSMSHQKSFNFIPVNGTRSRCLDSANNTDGEQKNTLSKENSLQNDLTGQSCVGNQKQVLNNLSSNKTRENELPSTSKFESNQGEKGSDVYLEKHASFRHKQCLDKGESSSNSINNGASTSGTSKSLDNPENNVCRENRKRPSTLKLNRPTLDADESSSDTGNDDYSLGSEDGCIYTYRGGEHLADLPSSFFSLDMGLPLDRHLPLLPNYPVNQQGAANAREQGSGASSPDMDFLEMDFDPGPSCEADTGDDSSPDADLEVANSMLEENEPAIRGTSPEYVPGPKLNPLPSAPATSASNYTEPHYFNVPSTSRGPDVPQNNVQVETTCDHEYGPYIMHTNFRGEQFWVKRTMSTCPNNASSTLHVSNGDLVSPREALNYEEDHQDGQHAFQINQSERSVVDSSSFSSALYHITMAKRLMIEKTWSDVENHDAANMSQEQGADSIDSENGCVDPPRCMVWSEREACERQVTQIGTSACGATAVVNVFIALGVPVNIEKINTAVGTRQRANNAPLPRYLLSRSVAGCTAADLVTGIQRASDGLVTARFFPTHPERAISLSHWLADWISLGAVPILTLNLQVGCDGEIPDAWHHQMVFGVSPRGVYLCNPVECVPETVLWPRLTSPSVLLVRTRDVLARFTTDTDLTPLMAVPDRRFHTFNVLGQVANVIREWRAHGWAGRVGRSGHVRLPASYRAGVTVAALTGSEAHRRLVHAAPPPPSGAPGHADPAPH